MSKRKCTLKALSYGILIVIVGALAVPLVLAGFNLIWEQVK